MAKGKHQASKTARDLRAALERIDHLTDELREERAAAHQREEALKAEVQNLKGRLIHEVETAAAEQVNALDDRRRAEVAEEQNTADRRVREGLQAIGRAIVGELRLNNIESWEAAAKRFGIPLSDLLLWVGTEATNREERRLKAGQVKSGRDRERRENPKHRIAEIMRDRDGGTGVSP